MWTRIHKTLRFDTLNMLKMIKQVRGEAVLVDQEEEHKIDFRVPGLSHAVTKEAEHLRVQELVKGSKIILIEKHYHADLQQNNVYNPIQQKFESDDPRIG